MINVIRPTWSGDAEQQRLLEWAIETCKKADEAIKHANEQGWDAILQAREAGVPDSLICEKTGWSRATLNRKFGKRK